MQLYIRNCDPHYWLFFPLRTSKNIYCDTFVSHGICQVREPINAKFWSHLSNNMLKSFIYRVTWGLKRFCGLSKDA